MKKYEEALYEITRSIGNHGWFGRDVTDVLQELVDKETPMKIVLGSEKDSPRCPNCDRWFPNRQEYCSKCGQRIDWEE